MTCIPTMRNPIFFGVCRKFSYYTSSAIILVTLGGSKYCKIINGAEIFKESICEGNPETSREFRNSRKMQILGLIK